MENFDIDVNALINYILDESREDIVTNDGYIFHIIEHQLSIKQTHRADEGGIMCINIYAKIAYGATNIFPNVFRIVNKEIKSLNEKVPNNELYSYLEKFFPSPPEIKEPSEE